MRFVIFVDPGEERLHEVEMLSGLLLHGTYEAESSIPTAPQLLKGLKEALALTTAIADDFHRTRRARSWLEAGRAALGCGDDALAEVIAAGIAPDLRDLRTALDGHPWRDREGFFNELFLGGQAVAFPELPDAHTRPEVVAAFEALLDKHQRRRRRRRPAKEPPPSE